MPKSAYCTYKNNFLIICKMRMPEEDRHLRQGVVDCGFISLRILLRFFWVTL